jgi:hypothetical protein
MLHTKIQLPSLPITNLRLSSTHKNIGVIFHFLNMGASVISLHFDQTQSHLKISWTTKSCYKSWFWLKLGWFWPPFFVNSNTNMKIFPPPMVAGSQLFASLGKVGHAKSKVNKTNYGIIFSIIAKRKWRVQRGFHKPPQNEIPLL